MRIRIATKQDCNAIAQCLYLAMDEILFSFMGKRDKKAAIEMLADLAAQEGNQYSYQNCFVTEHEGIVVGAVNVYNGALLNILRKPVAEYITRHFNQEFAPEDETQTGEWYIDSIGVLPVSRGMGVGTLLLDYVIDYYVKQKGDVIGLLVELDNPQAKKLYTKLGFQYVDKKTLVGKQLEHLQLRPDFSKSLE